jgi:hypothetical protein
MTRFARNVMIWHSDEFCIFAVCKVASIDIFNSPCVIAFDSGIVDIYEIGILNYPCVFAFDLGMLEAYEIHRYSRSPVRIALSFISHAFRI